MIFIAITTYGEIKNIISQLESIYSIDNEYWIHYNKREKSYKFQQLRKHLKKYPNVHVIRKYKIYWGHYSIIKSIINFQKIFLKSNKKYFLHIDAKTINIIPIEEISKYINDSFLKGYSFMGSFYKNIKKIYKQQDPESDLLCWYSKLNFYYKTVVSNSKFYKLHCLFLIIRKSIFNNPKLSTPPPLFFN